jgi:hypothetical protein
MVVYGSWLVVPVCPKQQHGELIITEPIEGSVSLVAKTFCRHMLYIKEDKNFVLNQASGYPMFFLTQFHKNY